MVNPTNTDADDIGVPAAAVADPFAHGRLAQSLLCVGGHYDGMMAKVLRADREVTLAYYVPGERPTLSPFLTGTMHFEVYVRSLWRAGDKEVEILVPAGATAEQTLDRLFLGYRRRGARAEMPVASVRRLVIATEHGCREEFDHEFGARLRREYGL